MFLTFTFYIFFSISLMFSTFTGRAQGGGGGLTQVDPCTIQSGMVGDAQYCDRWGKGTLNESYRIVKSD